VPREPARRARAARRVTPGAACLYTLLIWIFGVVIIIFAIIIG
jgi:hypothetical protein